MYTCIMYVCMSICIEWFASDGYIGSSMKEIYTEELSRDHHPDREDEKARIKAAGGFVRIWGVPRVNGILAVSRSIGDVNLKR